VAERGDNLDIAWLKDDSETAAEDLPEPEALAEEALGELEAAMADLKSILIELGDEVGSE
jgi:type I restriction enzyme M protein